MRYYELWWGDPPPSSGGNGGDPMGGLLLGVYYGYRSEAIADHVKQCQAKTGKVLDRKTILALIEKARNP